jgi:hypothetical protein
MRLDQPGSNTASQHLVWTEYVPLVVSEAGRGADSCGPDCGQTFTKGGGLVRSSACPRPYS